MDFSHAEILLAHMHEREGDVEGALGRLDCTLQSYRVRGFFCHGPLELEAVLMLNKSEALILIPRAPGESGLRSVVPP